MARTVVANLILTLDGVARIESVQAAIMGLIDEQVDRSFAAKIAEEDAMLLGRRTYEEWRDFWPGSEIEPFASHINGVPKYVASKTLKSVSWPTKGQAYLLSGDLREEVLALKDQAGGSIGVHGSPTLVGSLIQANVLDLLRLAIFPVVAGTGARLFGRGSPPSGSSSSSRRRARAVWRSSRTGRSDAWTAATAGPRQTPPLRAEGAGPSRPPGTPHRTLGARSRS